MVDLQKREPYSRVLSLTAYLLGYPDKAWWEGLDEVRSLAAELQPRQASQVLTDFVDYVKELGQKEYEELYVRTFDFSQNTNLYLTMHDRTDFGKQSNEMLRYKEMFLQNGFDLEKELPDYLPAILELAAAVPKKESGRILNFAKGKVELLRSRMIEAKLAYAFLLDVVLTETAGLEVAS